MDVAIRWRSILLGCLAWASVQAMTPSQAPAQLPAKDRMMSCDPNVALAAAREILNSPKSIQEPLEWFTPALTLFQHGQRDEALFWFYAAQLRTRYQLVFEKGDRGQLLSVMQMTMGGLINSYGFQDPARLLSTYDRVLAWDRATPNPWRERAQTPEQQAQIAKVYEGFEQLRQKVRSEGEALKEQVARQAEMHARVTGNQERCKAGQMDPSQVPQAKREEQKRLEQWIVQQRQIMQAVGRIERANVFSSSTNVDAGHRMPLEYQLVVHGERIRYIDVNVDRTDQGAHFTITCISSVLFGNRDLGDKCPK